LTIKKHNDVVKDLLHEDPNLKTKGFKQELVKLVRKLEPDIDDEINVIKDTIAFVPDAYSIDETIPEVTIYEVIDTHKIDKIKKWQLAWGWYAIDNFYISCKLVICDTYGGRNVIDLEQWLKEVTSSDEYPKGWPQAYRKQYDKNV
jgi:hypothetical protein